jgi:hypothetical protein
VVRESFASAKAGPFNVAAANLKTKEIVAVVPDQRKARAVQACFEGEISPMAPASILRTHPHTTVYLDKRSASMLSPALQELGEHELPATVRR